MTRDRFLSDAELARFMEAVRTRRHVNQPRDHCLFAILANTGIRPSEALALTRADVHPHARPPWMRVKRLKRRHAAEPTCELVLNAAVARVVGVHVAAVESGRLFPITSRAAQRLFRYYIKRAGIPDTFRIYALRHAAGMRLWRHTADVRLIQALLGHVHTRASYIYKHVTPESVRAAYEKAGEAT